MDLIKGQLVVGREDFDVVPRVHIPVVYPNNILWIFVDCSFSGRWGVHDVVQSKLDGTILEEVQYLVGVLNGGGYSIIFPPFGGLCGDMLPILPFICLHLELFTFVRVNGG